MDQEREELKQRERRKRSRRMEVISTLTELGYSRRDAARALHLADGDVDRACAVSAYLSVCLPVCLSTCLSHHHLTVVVCVVFRSCWTPVRLLC